MENLTEYIKPELLVLVPVLVILGGTMKKSEKIKDEVIPAVLGMVGMVLTAMWLLGNTVPENPQEWIMVAFTAIVQGLLVAGMAVYGHQIVHQAAKSKEVRRRE